MPIDKLQKLEYVSRLIAKCQKCPLSKTATNPVPGSGSPDAKIVFIGEAPGFFEDQQGLPFVGNSGKLLDKLLAKINILRTDVYICNILKHRPPENRDPLPEEIKVCTPYLKAQLEILRPQIIVTLGRFALNYFLPLESIGRIHGQIRKISWQGLDVNLIPLYHPSAGLRNGSMLRELESDFLKIDSFLHPQPLIVKRDPVSSAVSNPTLF
ncbi:MAG: uracil-DNA glycosylase [Patescibacteria group bacterium]